MPLFARGSRFGLPASFCRCAAAVAVASASLLSAQIPAARVAATSLRLPSEGSTLPYTSEPAFGGAYFAQPVQVVFAPGDAQRTFVVERPGRIMIVRDLAGTSREVFLDLTARTETENGGLLSVAFHPRFAENGLFYTWGSTYVGGQRANRLTRFRVSAADPHRADPASGTPLLTQLTGAGGHDGGMLLFGPDGYLYLALGDGDQNVPEIDAAHQRIDRGFFGGIVRLDVDLRPGSLAPNPHPSVHAGTYAIPPDNPFVGATAFNGSAVTPASVRTEWWAVGLRNPWRMAFDTDGRLWCADVGLVTREEVNLIVRGANYGWQFREGLVAGPRPDAPRAAAQFTDPIWDYPVSQGVSVTGGFVYRGNRYTDLFGTYLFADFVSGRIWALTDNGTRPLPAAQVRQIASETGITGLAFDPRTGDVLLADFDSNAVKRLVANPNAGGAPLPATLAATGIFSDVAALAPAPGVVPYAINAPFWSDHARKTRWFALPNTTSAFAFKADGAWTLPAGAVWVKHFDLELRRGVPASARRVETRVLVKTAGGLYGATYRWNDAQTDAALVAEGGGFQSYAVTETDGTVRTQTWSFPSRDACLACHTEGGGGALSFNTRQLNRPSPGSAANQLAALAAAGYLDTAPAAMPPAAALPALADPADTALATEARARAYLDANCAQCHRPSGTALGAFDARARTPLSLTRLVGGALVATPAATAADRVLVPGNAARSMLLRRMAGDRVGRMPAIGTHERDLAGEALLRLWIDDLARPRPPSRLLNLAARARVGTGDDILIPGFYIGGTTAKSVLVRAVGPGLAPFGVTGALARPVLTLFDGRQQAFATNTRWSTSPDAGAIRAAAARVGAFALPEGSADSALLVTLPPGAYTAQAVGADRTSGVALVEIYDADPAPDPAVAPRLINTAVRAQVGTGAGVLIPGLVVSAGAAKTVLIRAVGPTLGAAPFHVPGTLAQPVLTLFAGDEAFLTNAGWSAAVNAAEIRATAARVGAFALPDGSRDSALLVTLSPGPYTVQVAGANGTTGVALVEIYEVP
jgi:uncharacterized repeat protein (TIGR03806 family)